MANKSSLLVAGVVCVALACGGDSGDRGGAGGGDDGTSKDAGTSTPDDGKGGGALTVAFNPMYSAYDDGMHLFRVPVRVMGATGKLSVSTDPADFVSSEPSKDGVTLTTKKAGKATVTIKDEGGNSGSAELIVTKNGPDDVTIGEQRYANGIDAFTLPEGGFMFPEGGFPMPEGGFFNADGGLNIPEGGVRFPDGGGPPARNDMAACTFCHIPDGAPAPTADMLRVDVEHTPQQTAGFSDQDLIRIFTEGEKPQGAPFRVVNGGGLLPDAAAATIYKMFHKWTVDEATRKGLVAYLRSLTPKPQGEIDFGGLLRGAMMGGLGPRPTLDAGAP